MFNLFFLVGGAVVVGITLAIFVTRTSPPNLSLAQMLPEDDYHKDKNSTRRVSMKDLFSLGEKLCTENSLRVREQVVNSSEEAYWIAENDTDFFRGMYVFGFMAISSEHPMVTLSDVLEFKDFAKGVGGSRGFFFTDGFFSKDVHQQLEGPLVNLYNKIRVIGEMQRLNLSAG